MAIAFARNNQTFRLMFKYGWFFTNENYTPREVRGMLRDWMALSIGNSKSNLSGDLVFEDSKGHNGKHSKFAWRMCSVFINKITTTIVDSKPVIESELMVGPYTSVCVPGDRFSYDSARGHALATLKDSALKIYKVTPVAGVLPELFFIMMDGFTSYGTRKRGNKRK